MADDGGSKELKGAKCAGMNTVFTEYLDRKEEMMRREIFLWSDYHMDDFDELLIIIDEVKNSELNKRLLVKEEK